MELYGKEGNSQQQWLVAKYASIVHNILFYFSQFSNCIGRGAYFVFVSLLEILCRYLQMFFFLSTIDTKYTSKKQEMAKGKF